MKPFRLLLSLSALSLSPLAFAEDAAPAAASSAPPPTAACTLDNWKLQKLLPETEKRIALYGWVEAGFTYNPQAPSNNLNFGRAFEDRANSLMLNQAVLTAERALAPEKGEPDWGFKVQGLYGSDARYTRSLGLGDKFGDHELQLDLLEAYGTAHLPVMTDGGLDLKFGKFATLCANEVIDPRANFFYSHNYIFNFGPFNHFGGLAIFHATENLDLTAGAVRGTNVSLDDNNARASFHGAIALNNILGGKVATAAALCAGPETPHDDKDLRWFGTWVTTVKATDKINAITEAAWYQDDAGTGAKAYSLSQTLTYTVDSQWAVGLRAEAFRDQDGFFVVGSTNDADPARVLRGDAPTGLVGGGKTTYGALTLGANYKPCASVTIRPEIRYDMTLDNTQPFDAGNTDHQLTVAADIIWSF